MAQNPPASRTLDAPKTPGRSILRNPFAWAFVVGVVTLTLLRPALRNEPPPPPVLGQLPEFQLTEAAGTPYGSAELAGSVYVANFIFTRCASICPRLTAAMDQLNRRYDTAGVDGIQLVSITVDPEYDTPRRLGEYAALHEVESDRWKFLTGDPEQVRSLIVEGFRTPMGTPVEDPLPIDIAHTGKLVLVDPEGGIRGYYESDATGLDEVFHRSRRVLKEFRDDR